MTKQELKKYYTANIEWLKKEIERTDLTDQRKKHLAITEERIADFERCLKELA